MRAANGGDLWTGALLSSAVPMSVDPSDRSSRLFECTCCERPAERVWAFVELGDERLALYFATNYHHRGHWPETYVDVVLGTFGAGSNDDHVTFGCRIGPVGDHPEPDANYWEPCVDGAVSPLHGRLLSVEEAKRSKRLADFWNVIDVVLNKDPAVRHHQYGRRASLH